MMSAHTMEHLYDEYYQGNGVTDQKARSGWKRMEAWTSKSVLARLPDQSLMNRQRAIYPRILIRKSGRI